MKHYLMFIYCFILFAGTDIYAKSDYKDNFSNIKKYGRHKIKVRQILPNDKDISGKLPPQEEVKQAAKRFFAALDELPENFVKRSGLKYVTFLENPALKNIRVGGLAVGETMILPVFFRKKTIYHELFHIFDPKRENKKWRKLNRRGFVYTGSQYYDANLSRRKKKRKKQNLSSRKYNSDFVSKYAMSFEWEDRADTFAYMLVEKEKFLLRTKRSPVLKEKMLFIIEMTDNRKYIGKDFWEKCFNVDDLRKLE